MRARERKANPSEVMSCVASGAKHARTDASSIVASASLQTCVVRAQPRRTRRGPAERFGSGKTGVATARYFLRAVGGGAPKGASPCPKGAPLPTPPGAAPETQRDTTRPDPPKRRRAARATARSEARKAPREKEEESWRERKRRRLPPHTLTGQRGPSEGLNRQSGSSGVASRPGAGEGGGNNKIRSDGCAPARCVRRIAGVAWQRWRRITACHRCVTSKSNSSSACAPATCCRGGGAGSVFSPSASPCRKSAFAGRPRATCERKCCMTPTLSSTGGHVGGHTGNTSMSGGTASPIWLQLSVGSLAATGVLAANVLSSSMSSCAGLSEPSAMRAAQPASREVFGHPKFDAMSDASLRMPSVPQWRRRPKAALRSPRNRQCSQSRSPRHWYAKSRRLRSC